jgi:hypothetical protein
VSGGNYDTVNTGKTCKPYEFMPCAHHVPATSKYPECPSGEEYETPKCQEICSDTKYSVKFDDDKHFASDAYSLRSVEDIQLDMMQHGSVTAGMYCCCCTCPVVLSSVQVTL